MKFQQPTTRVDSSFFLYTSLKIWNALPDGVIYVLLLAGLDYCLIYSNFWSVLYTPLWGFAHTVVCRAAQETVVPPREYIDRKTKNVIFTPT